EIAYLPMGGDPFAPGNVAAGTFESVVGTAGILQRFAAAGGGAATGVRAILAAAKLGDSTAVRVIDDTARWTALGIAAVVALVDPEMVVLGGGIGTQPDFVNQVERHLRNCVARPVPVAVCVLGNQATLLGAIATAIADLPGSLFAGKATNPAAGSRRNPEAA
ncbi:MAG TPA: ROK family protein, partial [Alphaproteobacteria bacterium]|nr:ROK family protein [Alphaproteobacteria bacterium]